MKLRLVSIALGAFLALGGGALLAQPGPGCANCPNGGVRKMDGTGPGGKHHKGMRKQQQQGRRMGPRDGTGPGRQQQQQQQQQQTPRGQGRRWGGKS